MPGRLAQLLLALVVALSAFLTPPAPALPVPHAIEMAGMKECSACLQRDRAGLHVPPTCPALACAVAIATLPAPVPLPARRIFAGPAYRDPRPAAWVGATPAPDPFPPRPLVRA